MEFLIASIISIITQIEKDIFSGFRGRIKLYRLKRRLKREIFEKILKKYENEVYYNDLDHFLTDHDVISRIIRNCINTSVFHYKSQSQTIDYYVQLFIAQYPEHFRYYYEICNLIQKYFKVIFNTLNNTDREATRVVCNIVKELIGDLSNKLLENDKRIEQKIDYLIDMTEDNFESFSIEQYLSYLLCLYPVYSTDTYLQRNIYEKNDSENEFDALDTLISEKRVLVLGEAGFGKTYESIILLNKICKDKRTRDLIPFYFPLNEYGLLYTDIITGIKLKINPFCDGNVDKIIEKWLRNGELIFILDGVDDISQEGFKTKFIADINDISARYSKNLFFITSRFNRYYGELGEQRQYFLTGLSELTIRQELHEEGIIVDIPKDYYQLFSNPFFLSVGKTVLKKSHNRDIFNRSQLFDELFQQLYGGLEHKKGFVITHFVTYSEALFILGKFAYENFSQPAYSFLEFDQKLSKIIPTDRASIIDSFIGSGLFKISDHVIFVHKLLKEYCAAYYLINAHPLSTNTDLYADLVQRDEWREVFIFAGGIYKETNEQDNFLDFVMKNNLSLYIECVNAKSDLSIYNNAEVHIIINELLSQIYKTYKFIISYYLHAISDLFEPLNASKSSGKKVAIFGCLSKDGSWLNYWFDLVPTEDNEINCINEQQLQYDHKAFEKRALLERRSISSYGVSIQQSGLSIDSGRKIAVDLIKKRLKEIINKKRLIESKYLLCERVPYYQHKLKVIRNMTDLIEMQTVVDALIIKELQVSPDMVRYNYNGVELFDLQSLLHHLNGSGTKLFDYILPGPDKPMEEITSCWAWDLYSKEQKGKRITLFFYYHELSYMDMVINNFPKLCCSFSRFQDAPYQSMVIVNYKDNDMQHDFSSDPSILYYHIATPGNDVPLPILCESENRESVEESERIFQEIQKSYLNQGKTAHRITYTQTGFSFTLTSRRSRNNDPLSDYVYESIQESLEEVFGSFN